MNMLWTLLVTKKTSEYYHEKPMENYQSRITAQKDPSEKWLVSWGGFVDFLFQPLPLILQLHTLENEHIFWSQNWDLDGRCRCRFFFSTWGWFFAVHLPFHLKDLFFWNGKKLSEDFGGICQVVNAQAYALHCGRIDVCFRFASPLNRLMTGISGTAWLVGERMIHEGI